MPLEHLVINKKSQIQDKAQHSYQTQVVEQKDVLIDRKQDKKQFDVTKYKYWQLRDKI